MFSLRKISVSVILIFLSSGAAGNDPYFISAGASEAGMGYSCITKSDFWSSFHNQALLSHYNSLGIGCSYENRFNMQELSTRCAGIIFPAGKASLGAVYSCFGYSDFHRGMAGIACGLNLSEKISAGVMIDYFTLNTYDESNNTETVTFETGIIIRASKNITLGIHLFNPLPDDLRKNHMPSRIRTGAGIYLSKWLFAATEAEISSGEKLIFKTGFEYEAGKKVLLRGGFRTIGSSFSMGAGYKMKFVKLDIGFATHEKLGITSSASLVFNIN